MQKKYELEKRTKNFAVNIIKFVSCVEVSCISQVLNYQLLKSSTSVGANYREANRAESRNDFVHKIAIVQKEASETQYWLELYCAVEIGDKQKREALMQESTELLAIFTSIGKALKGKKTK